MTCPVNHTYDALFQAAGQAYGVDPALLKAHAAQESAFDPHAYRAEPRIGDASYGLMQLLYTTARRYSNVSIPTAADRQELTGLYEPGLNVPLAARLIADNLAAAGGDVDTAIAAYNEGIGRALEDRDARRAWRTYDPNYVANVKACYQAYQADFDGSGPPAPDTPAGGLSPGAAKLLWAAVLLGVTYLVERMVT